MFDINDLKDKLGYEKWVLKESILAIEKHKGIKSDRTIRFEVDGTKTHFILAYDELGSDKRVEILEKLSPLLFVTSYKIIDMIFEWILIENGSTSRKFAEKIRQYEILSQGSNFSLPPSIDLEKPLIEILFRLYKNLSVYRNQIIHGSWGTNNSGNLVFSFRKNRTEYNKQITFKNVINLAECISLFAEEIIVPSGNKHSVFSTVKYLLDKLENLHEGSLFNIPALSHFKVEYELSDSTEIDFKQITDHLNKQTYGNPYSFSLRVISSSKTWEFPWNYIKDYNKLILNSSMDMFVV